jgi:exopolysaccharide biosynthesis polyprenyl glycosylphosphotransferase
MSEFSFATATSLKPLKASPVATPQGAYHATVAAPSPVRAPTTFRSSSRAPFEELATLRSRREAAHHWVFFAVVGDLTIAFLGSVLAFFTRFETLQHFGNFAALDISRYLGYLFLGPSSLIVALAWLGIYQKNMLLQPRKVARRMIKGSMLWTLGFLLVALAFSITPALSRIYMGLNGAITLLLLLAWRLWFDARLREPHRMAVLQQRAVLVGWTEDTADLEKHFEQTPDSALQMVGWVSTGDESNTLESGQLPFLGNLEDLEELIVEHRVDMVVLGDLGGPRERTLQIAELCEREMVQFKIIPSCFRIFVSGLEIETVAGTPIIGVSSLPLDSSLNVFMKRAVDVVGAIVGLILSAPLIALFGAVVWLESRGAIFYKQVRTGANGKNFNIFKIRSMRLNAESSGAQWCVANDPRRLRVGAFMRKWNIDELPQFWNVLKGEMSLVGPRPERPELIANFKHQIPHYNARHHAKPGMTGWAAVKGLRGDTDLSARIRADIWYLENWSALLDFQIMLMTFIKRENAY